MTGKTKKLIFILVSHILIVADRGQPTIHTWLHLSHPLYWDDTCSYILPVKRHLHLLSTTRWLYFTFNIKLEVSICNEHMIVNWYMPFAKLGTTFLVPFLFSLLTLVLQDCNFEVLLKDGDLIQDLVLQFLVLVSEILPSSLILRRMFTFFFHDTVTTLTALSGFTAYFVASGLTFFMRILILGIHRLLVFAVHLLEHKGLPVWVANFWWRCCSFWVCLDLWIWLQVV